MLQPQEVKNTYGTGCFILMNVGNQPVQSTHGLLSTVCYSVKPGEVFYALEGAVETAGAAITWAKKIGLINMETIEADARSVEDSGDVYFVPSFSGIFSPYWDDQARGLLIGLNHGTTREHIVRAILEAACLRSDEVVTAMRKDAKVEQNIRMMVDGGMSVNDLVLQSQADFSSAIIVRKQEQEVTGLGAAIAAGLHAGLFTSL